MSLADTITAKLKERISALPDGTKFATEAELCREFGVSRMTVNKILTSLAGEGLLKRYPRRGTFVCHSFKNGQPEIAGTIFEMRKNSLKLHIAEYYYSRTNAMWQMLLKKLQKKLSITDIELTDDAASADLVWCTTRPDLDLPTLNAISSAPEDIETIRQFAGDTNSFPCLTQNKYAALPLTISVNITLWNRKHFERLSGTETQIPENMVSDLLKKDYRRMDFPHVVSYLFCPLILMSLTEEGIIGYDPQNGNFDFSGDKLYDHLRFHREMYRKLSPYLSNFDGADEIFEKFNNGEIMALNTFSSQLNYGRNMPECKVSYRHIANRIPGIACYIGIGRNSTNRLLAARAAGILAGEELSLFASGFHCSIPANRQAAYSQEFLSGMPDGTREMLDMLNMPLPLIEIEHFFAKGKIYADAIGKYIIGDFNVDDIKQYLLN